MKKQLLEKYFEGKADKKLKKQVIAWATASEENTQQFVEAKVDWTLRNLPNEPADADDFLRFAKHENRRFTELTYIEKRQKIIGRIYRIAAVIAIPLLFASVFQQIRLSQKLNEQKKTLQIAHFVETLPEQNQPMLEYIVNPGVKGRVLLPDGSEVWLNSHSTLRSPSQFDSLTRIVELDGEAFFKINTNSEWPFYVQTPRGVSIKVTGTEFNLSAYDNDPFLKVTLLEGGLKVIDNASLQAIALQPMQELILPNNEFDQAIQGVAKQVQEDIAWKEGLLLFNSTPMDAIIRRMERWYGATITVDDPRILNFRITAEFENESLIQVLEILRISSNIRYQVDGNRVRLFL
jgi:ferric-dicitrate binding protein FerR (iron transport regulator)